MNAIETMDLTKSYNGRKAVESLNLVIQEGELFALLGVNGAGKTTTIKMLSGLIQPSDGDANIMGNSILTQTAEVKSLINVSPQETAVAPGLTVMENLELIAGIYGSKKEEAKKKAEQVANELGLSEISSQKAKTLSGGWQRRLSIAMALISDPKVLFLDEPTLGLDVLARRELWNVIEGLKGKVTVILTTHYLEEAESLADRIGIMANGRLQIVGSVGNLVKKANVSSFEDAFIAFAQKGGETTCAH